jgi:hypothetical protein
MSLRKHISFLLFVIFVFPIIFQSVHIVWHKSHGNKCEHHLCHQNIVDKDSQITNVNTPEEEGTCPICEYQFSINDLPGLSLFSIVIPAFTFVCNEIVARQQYNQVFSDSSPRAPPVHIS